MLAGHLPWQLAPGPPLVEGVIGGMCTPYFVLCSAVAWFSCKVEAVSWVVESVCPMTCYHF